MDGLGSFRDHHPLNLPLIGESSASSTATREYLPPFQIANLDKRIGRLAEWMEKRVSNMDKLLQLQGKLELIVEQMAIRSKPVLYAAQEPAIIFDVGGEWDRGTAVG